MNQYEVWQMTGEHSSRLVMRTSNPNQAHQHYLNLQAVGVPNLFLDQLIEDKIIQGEIIVDAISEN